MTSEEYNYWLGSIPGIGSAKIDKLLSEFKNTKEIYESTRNELIHRTNLKETEIDLLLASRNNDRIRKTYGVLKEKRITYVTKQDSNYPERLKNICQAPFGLYIKGKLPQKERKALAIVGARNCTIYGREIAKYLAGAIAREGIDIISGLARGIDSYAHLGAIRGKGKTYAVLGCGIDICYPKENLNLYMEIQQNGGILSEFSLGSSPLAFNFPIRNRIISGLSDGVLVIEAKEKSGSLITVDIGLEQGKEIYAVPGRMTDLSSSGCNNLIKIGAKPVTSPQDILEDFIVNYRKEIQNISELQCTPSVIDKKHTHPLLNPEERLIYNTLSLDAKHITIIAQETRLDFTALAETLLHMEMKHLIHQTIKNYYIIQL
jgi:DNA processing protein